MPHTTRCLLVFGTVLFGNIAVQATTSFMDLGTLGGEYVYVRTISGDGSVVVGRAENADGNDEAFIWTQTGGMVGLREP